jgi:hypothetical protein
MSLLLTETYGLNSNDLFRCRLYVALNYFSVKDPSAIIELSDVRKPFINGKSFRVSGHLMGQILLANSGLMDISVTYNRILERADLNKAKKERRTIRNANIINRKLAIEGEVVEYDDQNKYELWHSFDEYLLGAITAIAILVKTKTPISTQLLLDTRRFLTTLRKIPYSNSSPFGTVILT